jgi:hypothetical protein
MRIPQKNPNNESPKVFAVMAVFFDQISEAVTLGTREKLKPDRLNSLIAMRARIKYSVTKRECRNRLKRLYIRHAQKWPFWVFLAPRFEALNVDILR